MGTHLIVLSESYPINTNLIGLKWFSKIIKASLDASDVKSFNPLYHGLMHHHYM